MRAKQCPSCETWTPGHLEECLSCGSPLVLPEPQAEDVPVPVATPIVERTKDDRSGFGCPKCKSTHLAANKKGFGLGKALVGGALFGGVGLLGGFLGSGKVRVTCLQCGHTWNAGKR